VHYDHKRHAGGAWHGREKLLQGGQSASRSADSNDWQVLVPEGIRDFWQVILVFVSRRYCHVAFPAQLRTCIYLIGTDSAARNVGA